MARGHGSLVDQCEFESTTLDSAPVRPLVYLRSEWTDSFGRRFLPSVTGVVFRPKRRRKTILCETIVVSRLRNRLTKVLNASRPNWFLSGLSGTIDPRTLVQLRYRAHLHIYARYGVANKTSSCAACFRRNCCNMLLNPIVYTRLWTFRSFKLTSDVIKLLF